MLPKNFLYIKKLKKKNGDFSPQKKSLGTTVLFSSSYTDHPAPGLVDRVYP
jgi:hypothetical protein